MNKTLCLLLFSVCNAFAASGDPTVDFERATQETKSLLGSLIEKDTSNPPGNEGRAVDVLAQVFKKNGIPYQIDEFAPGRKSIVARLKAPSSKRQPLLLLAHLDVVQATDQEWSTPPHKLTEKEGHLYGRGVMDDLGMAAAGVEVLLQLKKNKIALHRDVILALTGDEEVQGAGLVSLFKKHPEWIQAGLVLNEGGSPVMDKNGAVSILRFQVAEKIQQDYILTSKAVGGHSARGHQENAILKIATALKKISAVTHPLKMQPLMKNYFEERAKSEEPAVAKALRKIINSNSILGEDDVAGLKNRQGLLASLRTTCVPTLINSGTQANVLPTSATATINCRLVAEDTPEIVLKRLEAAVKDLDVHIQLGPSLDGTTASSPTEGEGPTAIRKVAGEMWPGIAVIPGIQLGMTDSRRFRALGIPAYGLNPFPMIEEDLQRTHGVDERVPVASFRKGIEFYYRLVLELSAVDITK